MISSIIQDNETQHSQYSRRDRPKLDKWVIELVITSNGISKMARIEVHVLTIISRVISRTLELVSSRTKMTHNLQVTIIVGENNDKKKHNTWGHPLLDRSLGRATRHQFTNY